MKVELSFEEVLSVLKDNYCVPSLIVTQVDENTIKIAKPLLIVSPSVKVSILDVCNNDITIRNNALTSVASKVLGFFGINIKTPVVSMADDRIIIHLQEIPQLAKALEKVSLDDIRFTNDSVVLNLSAVHPLKFKAN